LTLNEDTNPFNKSLSPYSPFKVIFLHPLMSFTLIYSLTAEIGESWVMFPVCLTPSTNGKHRMNIRFKEKGSLLTAVAIVCSISMT